MALAKIPPTTVPIATPAAIGAPTVVVTVAIVAAAAVYAAEPPATPAINAPAPLPEIVVKNEANKDYGLFEFIEHKEGSSVYDFIYSKPILSSLGVAFFISLSLITSKLICSSFLGMILFISSDLLFNKSSNFSFASSFESKVPIYSDCTIEDILKYREPSPFQQK